VARVHCTFTCAWSTSRTVHHTNLPTLDETSQLFPSSVDIALTQLHLTVGWTLLKRTLRSAMRLSC
jgi:hypothetical protein